MSEWARRNLRARLYRMTVTHKKATVLHRAVRRLVSIRPISLLLSKFIHTLDKWMLKTTDKKQSFTGFLTGLPLISVKMIGAHSGKERHVILLGIPEGDNLILVASNWGQRKNPSWYHNMRAHPDIEVTINGRSAPYIAHVTKGKDREQCLQLATKVYLGYSAYEYYADNREIPVLRLTPNNNQ